MHAHDILALALLATPTAAHGVVTMIRGANGVNMPGLTVADGTPRDCSSNRCGSQADTAIIRDREISSGRTGPLGRTQGRGNVDPAEMIATFMGTAGAPARINAANASVGVEDDLSGLSRVFGGRNRNQQRDETGGVRVVARQFLDRLRNAFGGGRNGNSNSGTPTTQATETNVAAMAGLGATQGLPTCADDGTIEMVFRQINQDGAGPLTAAIDGTSGGRDPAAFQNAPVIEDVPGVAGFSLSTVRDFTVRVQMPAGMTCDGTVAGVNNVCIVRVRNNAIAGPFGGSAAFTQSSAARKRAVEYQRKMKRAVAFKA
ncbi:hypothetical protein VTJ83DRAFT_4635 [Remersonia thermophila]|uniref:Cell surface protein n=1 Tax=Remersonia thermophila TaxID=72144 RepID=A0ABR4DAK5_9PEZI